MDYVGSTVSWNGHVPDPDTSNQLLIRDFPHRAIAIVSQTHALIFRHSGAGSESQNGSSSNVNSGSGNGSGHGGGSAKCMVEFSPISKGLLSDYRSLTPRPVYGTLGLIAVNQDVFLSVITQALRVATLRPGETVEMIQQVQFFCLNTNEYDDVLSAAIDPWDPDGDAASVYSQGLSRRDVPVEHPCQELMKLLGNRSFYYSTDFDMTNRLQDRSADASSFDIDNFDESFLWNSFMIQPLVQFRARLQPHERRMLDASRILTSAVRGFCLTVTIPQSVAPLRTTQSGMPSYLTVISRLSCRRAGTRFNARGIDDDGNVANFVETETIYWSPSGVVFSYVQVRGSVPVFWEQSPGLIPGNQKIIVTRSPDGAQPAFDKHFDDLETSYGAVHVINLLSEAKPGEAELSQCYRYGLRHTPLGQKSGDKGSSSDHALIRSTEYDFHAETRGPTGYEAAQEIRHYIRDSANGFAYYLAMEAADARNSGTNGRKASTASARRRFVVALQQEGVFRTNCLDCLDRTNLIQTIISQMAVETFLKQRNESAGPDFWMRHSNLWADNGDALSKIYAGTGALKSSFTRHGKMSLAGAIADARKSATRLYINNFADKGRQNTIDMLLGRLYGQAPVILFDPISDYVTLELNKRAATFSSSEVIKIWVGTFNLNGRLDGLHEDLSPWLFPVAVQSAEQLPEIVAIGFQEIVELSPQQIMNSDPTRKQQWEVLVLNTLNKQAAALGGEPYVLLRSGQLVGAALCIFVTSSSLAKIKNVEGSVKKTGMSGMAGNKGAVGIRLDYANTAICFVTAHLAAGFANYEERNRDYLTIHHGLRFQRNRGIDDHDAVLWFGDFNYRIGLGRERTLDLVRAHNLETLYENDQLNLQMVAGLAFPYYSEARITFLPTYRFDIGRDDYDTSEKQRIPAWTDRILRRGQQLRQTAYNSAPLRFSDHRPVYAHFQCTVNIVDEVRRDKISRELYERRKGEVGDATANTTVEDTDDEDLIGYDAIEPGLPAASSDRQKWWLDNGRMAQARVQPPPPANPATHTAILNPKRPANPFAPTDEPDWVAVPRAESQLSSFSSLSTSPYEHINHSTVLSSSANSQNGSGGTTGGTAGLAASRKGGQPMGQSLSSQFYRQETTTTTAPPPPPPPRRGGAGTGDSNDATSVASKKSASTTSFASTFPGPPPPPNARVPPTVSGVTKALDELRASSSSSPSSFSNASDRHGGPPVPPRQMPTKVNTTFPPPPTNAMPPRPASVASSTSVSASGTGAGTALSAKGKPVPPVAKKPAHLASAPSTTPSPTSSRVGLASEDGAGRGTPPPKPPRRRTEAALPATTDAPPKLPARTPTVASHSHPLPTPTASAKARSSNVDLLGDDEAGTSLSRYQPLQPS
ncbi:synaptojanin-like protein [Sporothrix schenckii 1099-18]|uniref:phosphoinositide 5-phosphatase n=1 Tax=Sporothrix schenckii 1099-18 TaxID=1397361 RepID=A0A0F2LYL2_SPOSC|nr:synaptojanin-like protein [Sporothrix schenckii 1099-18]KJR80976.1 synaptojanin-like protein [Sporothrix schenckii 1099-18]